MIICVLFTFLYEFNLWEDFIERFEECKCFSAFLISFSSSIYELLHDVFDWGTWILSVGLLFIWSPFYLSRTIWLVVIFFLVSPKLSYLLNSCSLIFLEVLSYEFYLLTRSSGYKVVSFPWSSLSVSLFEPDGKTEKVSSALLNDLF